MKELSLNILDIAKNSVKAGADNIEIIIEETDSEFVLSINDDGSGMKQSFLESVIDPFCTTRTTRKVGMGIPLLKMEAELTGGGFDIESKHFEEYPDCHGTKITAKFYKNHIDFTPLGDIVASIITLIQGSPNIDWYFKHNTNGKVVELNTKELREILGEDVSLGEYEVIKWVTEYLNEQYSSDTQ